MMSKLLRRLCSSAKITNNRSFISTPNTVALFFFPNASTQYFSNRILFQFFPAFRQSAIIKSNYIILFYQINELIVRFDRFYFFLEKGLSILTYLMFYSIKIFQYGLFYIICGHSIPCVLGSTVYAYRMALYIIGVYCQKYRNTFFSPVVDFLFNSSIFIVIYISSSFYLFGYFFCIVFYTTIFT